MRLVGTTVHHGSRADVDGLAIAEEFAGAFGDDHELFFGMGMGRMGGGSGVEQEAAGGHRTKLIGGAVEVNAEFTEGVFLDFDVFGVLNLIIKSGI